MCVSFCVSVFVKDSTGSEREQDRVRERKERRDGEGGGSLPESKQRQQAAAPSSVTEAP